MLRKGFLTKDDIYVEVPDLIAECEAGWDSDREHILMRAVGIVNQDIAIAGRVYPVPQNGPCVSAGMNPVPIPPRENHALPVQNSWNGVNVPDSLQGQCPKATDVSPWYGVYQRALEAGIGTVLPF